MCGVFVKKHNYYSDNIKKLEHLKQKFELLMKLKTQKSYLSLEVCQISLGRLQGDGDAHVELR